MTRKLLGVTVLFLLLAASAAMAQTHVVQAKSNAGGVLTIMNAPGASYSGPFSTQDGNYLVMAAQLANWSTQQVAALQSFVLQADTCVYTLYREVDPKDPDIPQYVCTGAAFNCTAPCAGSSFSGGTASLSVMLM